MINESIMGLTVMFVLWSAKHKLKDEKNWYVRVSCILLLHFSLISRSNFIWVEHASLRTSSFSTTWLSDTCSILWTIELSTAPWSSTSFPSEIYLVGGTIVLLTVPSSCCLVAELCTVLVSKWSSVYPPRSFGFAERI